MKKYFGLILLAFLVVVGCEKEVDASEDNNSETSGSEETNYNPSIAYELIDVAYGSHTEQKMDVYLPANRNGANTKTLVLIHGGGWNAGDKADMNYMIANLQQFFPEHAIINLNYRLGSVNNPGYPMQVEDIGAAIQEIQNSKYDLAKEYFLIGGSAGGHLALLYGYAFDENNEVKGIANTVGPTDLTDPSYSANPEFDYGFFSLFGPVTYEQNPEIYQAASPVTHVSENSPKTISFFGGDDPLVPATQMNLLHDKLDAFGVINEKTMYEGEGHGNWSASNAEDYGLKLFYFINTYFN